MSRRPWHAFSRLLIVLILAVSPLSFAKDYDSVLAVYQANRREGLPNYVTQDVYLLAYQDLSRQELRVRETESAQALSDWLAAVRLASGRDAKKDDPEEVGDSDALIAVRDLLDMLASLAGEDVALSDRAAAEVALVNAAEGLAQSPLWQSRLDYSQFKARGRYAESEEGRRYFHLVRYLNTALFYVNPSKATGVTEAVVAQHMAMLRVLINWGAAGDTYQTFIAAGSGAGLPDDFSLLDVPVQEGSDIAAQLRNLAKLEARYPQVLQGYIERTALVEGERPEQALLGVRLLPGLIQADTIAMQVFVNDAGKWVGKSELPFSATAGAQGLVKGWPLANDVMASMGVAEARGQLKNSGDDQFEHYETALGTAAAAFENRPELEQANWALFRAIAKSSDDASSALAIARAFWTLQRHENVLYAKQSYTMVDRSMAPLVDRSASTIEPAIETYEALRTVVKLRIVNAPQLFQANWQAFSSILEKHLSFAHQVKQGEELSQAAHDALADIDIALKELGAGADKPRVIDVHTHPGEGQVLQEATAWAIVEFEGKARGARMSHREFTQPLSNRLTDAAWRKQLLQEKRKPQGE